MLHKYVEAAIAQLSNVPTCKVPKITHGLSIIVAHLMAHWKVVALFAMHELHSSLVYSFALLAAMGFAEHVFIYSVKLSVNERHILIVIHYLTVIAYSINVVLRGHRAMWGLAIIGFVCIHALCLRLGIWVVGILSAIDVILLTSAFEVVFNCDNSSVASSVASSAPSSAPSSALSTLR